ncbi:sodium-extruding oxaloacetate decarboxylase subunit alpha [Cellvibrio sp. PSBB023]|uniref:sodium-extruding oxaloacetate decarboxylase subunit alpha n=1 Tax=Cellvibrio sp. PSBB023 TaxID=1945512 RepID=UPI0009902BC2|nr:sodium-extruding oxaloacetate decarboxylase subunit alpha [Cellvibrio sp. PSBB023]AQT60237.1 oxaloacetate decarboxylase subunit alpha [Cellvibrio sp. PSBB023]
MINNNNPLGITDVVLRDAHQSLFATRLRLDDMLPIAAKLDSVGFWSLESWGGATFDACIRYLGEDPWDRIRELKKAMPKTPQQMLLRGQNLLGYRHYADDVVEAFVERAATSGVDVFRVFDAMNDMRNIEIAMKAVKRHGKHAQGTLSYTLSPVHNLDGWIAQAKQIEDMGADSICIKDMAGLLKPYDGFKLVKRLKAECDIPIHMQCHATTGLAHATILKCVEAGIDNVDTAISSMSMTYGHSPTETLVAALEGTNRDTKLDLVLLEEIATYFREMRKKYAKFEGSLKGVDARILIAQVPGGMLTNMESQLREQGAIDRFDEVLAEIPRVREDLGFIPLVTPTSQIVGTQAVLNVLSGERYKNISKETAGVLRGEYGSTPAPMNAELQAKVLQDGEQPITCRPADNLAPELAQLTSALEKEAALRNITLRTGEGALDDVLTYALFPQIGLRFLEHRHNPTAFEPAPTGKESSVVTNDAGEEIYTVEVDGKKYTVSVNNGGDLTGIKPLQGGSVAAKPAPTSEARQVPAPLAGNIIKIAVNVGDEVQEGDVLLLLEAMKMETQISAPCSGTITSIDVKTGDSVVVGKTLLAIAGA